MKIETMRKIDYAVGIPLSFFFSLISLFIPSRKMMGAKPKKVLFIELSEMGSAIIVDPAMREAIAELRRFCPMVKWLGSYPQVG